MSKVRWAMKLNLVLYLLLAFALILWGCASNPDNRNSKDDRKAGLFLLEGGMVCQEVMTNKMWQLSKEGPFVSSEKAERYAAGLNLGGYDDWRLPTKSELFDLFYMHYWQNDGNCVMNYKGEFWAVSRDHESSLGHWEDDLLCGPEFKFVDSIKDHGFVRAVRP